MFEGFLPRSGRDRTTRLTDIAAERRTVVLYEAPHRIVRTIDDLGAACGPARRVAVARELTKLHEDTWRGTLDAAVEHLAQHPPRGEYVVVVEGAPPPSTEITDDDLRAALATSLDNGSDRRAAVATVVTTFGVPKRRVYDLATALPRRLHDDL